jgi:hypothetical protein
MPDGPATRRSRPYDFAAAGGPRLLGEELRQQRTRSAVTRVACQGGAIRVRWGAAPGWAPVHVARKLDAFDLLRDRRAGIRVGH